MSVLSAQMKQPQQRQTGAEGKPAVTPEQTPSALEAADLEYEGESAALETAKLALEAADLKLLPVGRTAMEREELKRDRAAAVALVIALTNRLAAAAPAVPATTFPLQPEQRLTTAQKETEQ
jgi:hypothetical protein